MNTKLSGAEANITRISVLDIYGTFIPDPNQPLLSRRGLKPS